LYRQKAGAWNEDTYFREWTVRHGKGKLQRKKTEEPSSPGRRVSPEGGLACLWRRYQKGKSQQQPQQKDIIQRKKSKSRGQKTPAAEGGPFFPKKTLQRNQEIVWEVKRERGASRKRSPLPIKNNAKKGSLVMAGNWERIRTKISLPRGEKEKG